MRALATTVLCAAVAAVAPQAGAQDFADVEIASTPVAEGVFLLTGRGGNIGLLTGPDGPLLIDDQFAPLAPKIRAAVARHASEPVRFVLNTHWHGDHTGGNQAFGDAGALLIAHENVRARMSTDQVQALRGRTVPASTAAAWPVLTFDRTITLHWNGVTVRALHADAAHTDGDAMVHLVERDVLHMGDVFFNGLYPFVDVDSGGSIDGIIAATDVALGLAGDSTRILPGHGPLARRSDLVAYREMLVGVRAAIARELAAGKDVAGVVAARPTAAWDAAWGGGFMDPATFTRLVATDLSR